MLVSMNGVLILSLRLAFIHLDMSTSYYNVLRKSRNKMIIWLIHVLLKDSYFLTYAIIIIILTKE